MFFALSALSAQNNPYYEDTGGEGIRIAVLQPVGINMPAQEQWLLRLVQSTVTGDFNKFSAMTVIDRQNLDSILSEQNLSLSGNFSEIDYISIGNMANARYIVTGSLSKTGGGFILELSVSHAESGVRIASFSPKNCSLDELQSTAVIRQAGEELLAQLDISLTAAGKQALLESISSVPQAAPSAETSATVTTGKGERLSFVDYLSETADALYTLGELHNALSYYKSLTYYFPGYYKGWLGIVRCYSVNYTNFNFVDSELYMERAFIAAATDAEKREVQTVQAAFNAQWPRISALRAQQAIEEAKRREDNFRSMRFQQTDGVLTQYNGSSEEVIIPPEITAIGDAAFRQNGRIKRVVLHSRVTSIGRNAFTYCSGLTEIVIPSTVTSIGANAFYGCTNLVEIIIPAGIGIIPTTLFSGCQSLQSVTIAPGIQRIGSSAFSGCESLTTIIIPRSVTAIDEFAFSQCKNLKTVTLLNNNITIGRRAFLGTSLENKDEMISRFGAEIFN